MHRLRRVFFLMIRRPPRSTLDRSSAASDVYKRQHVEHDGDIEVKFRSSTQKVEFHVRLVDGVLQTSAVSYTHLRAHETVLDLVCSLLLEKKNNEN